MEPRKKIVNSREPIVETPSDEENENRNIDEALREESADKDEKAILNTETAFVNSVNDAEELE